MLHHLSAVLARALEYTFETQRSSLLFPVLKHVVIVRESLLGLPNALFKQTKTLLSSNSYEAQAGVALACVGHGAYALVDAAVKAVVYP